jgi:hypothetical protein
MIKRIDIYTGSYVLFLIENLPPHRRVEITIIIIEYRSSLNNSYKMKQKLGKNIKILIS